MLERTKEFDWVELFLLILKRDVKVWLNELKLIYENVLKMHGHKSKFIMKVVQVIKKNKKSFQKEGEDFWN